MAEANGLRRKQLSHDDVALISQLSDQNSQSGMHRVPPTFSACAMTIERNRTGEVDGQIIARSMASPSSPSGTTKHTDHHVSSCTGDQSIA